jgi:hypothetical protein
MFIISLGINASPLIRAEDFFHDHAWSSNPPLRLHLRNILHHIHLLLIRTVVLRNTTETLSELLAAAADLVPGQVEDGVDRLEALVGQLGEEEVDPYEADGGHADEEEHGAAGAHGEEHGGDSFGVAVFCGKC